MQFTVPSVRGRILFGAAFWTVGLVMFLAIVLTAGHGRLSIPAIALHSAILLVLASGCMVAGFSMVRGALAPFDRLRSRLSGVRRGSESRLRGEYPIEVQPLVDEVNALLSHSENAVMRATAKAGDLAHGLKTPLAVLSNEAELLAAAGNAELAASIGEQVEKMRREVEYHLAHARAAGSGAAIHATAPLSESVEGLVRALLRLHAPRGLDVGRVIDSGHVFRGRRQDLDEMLGNILDNACKWAKSRIAVSSSRDGEEIVVTVDDDGPGVAESEYESVMNRGVRADEAVPGSGLGLAIVRDLADLYGGSIRLEASPLGGLRARLGLPAASPRDDVYDVPER
jgi:signal transduction histidine kinase